MSKGYSAPEARWGGCGAEHLLIEQAEALGETLEDPLLLFSVLYGILGGEPNSVQRRCLS